MPNDKDTLSNEAGIPKPKAPFGTQTASKLLGKLADVMANRSIFGGMQSRQVAQEDVPRLNPTPPVTEGGENNHTQLNVMRMDYTSPDSGRTHQIEGYHLPAQNGKPTVVFFGGTDMDREAEHYKTMIQSVANIAKRQGAGLLVMDYPPNANQGKIHDYVRQVQEYAAGPLRVPMNAQAYAGYSLGGNPALVAANNNPEAAGLHLTSTVSSIRQESKNVMKGSGLLGRAADKGQLTTLMDNIKEARALIAAQTNRAEGPMPVSLIYSSQERFGDAANKHMPELERAFTNYPDRSKVQVTVSDVAEEVNAHQEILNQDAHLNSLRDFALAAVGHMTTRQNLAVAVAAPAPTVDDTAPTLDAPAPAVDAPAPAVDDTAPTVDDAAPIVDDTAPTVDAPEPTVDAPEPTVDAPEPTVDDTAPTVDAPEPAVDDTAPTVDAPAPTVDAPAPTVDAPAPTVDAPAPTVGGTPPVVARRNTVGDILQRTKSSPALLEPVVGLEKHPPAANSLRAGWKTAQPSVPKLSSNTLTSSV